MRTNTVLLVLALVSLAASAVGTAPVKYCQCKDKEVKKDKDSKNSPRELTKKNKPAKPAQHKPTDKPTQHPAKPTQPPAPFKEFTLVCPGDKNWAATLPKCKKDTTIGSDHTCKACPLPACGSIGGRCVSNCKTCQQGCRANAIALGVPFLNNKQCATVKQAACDGDQVCCIARKPLCKDIGGQCSESCTAFEAQKKALKFPEFLPVTNARRLIVGDPVKPLQVSWTDIARCTKEGQICCTFVDIDNPETEEEKNPWGIAECTHVHGQKCLSEADVKADEALAEDKEQFVCQRRPAANRLLADTTAPPPPYAPLFKYFCQDKDKFCCADKSVAQEAKTGTDLDVFDYEAWQFEFTPVETTA